MSLVNPRIEIDTDGYPLTGWTFAVLGGILPDGTDYTRRSQGNNNVFTSDAGSQPFTTGVEYSFTMQHPDYCLDEHLVRATFSTDGKAVITASPAENATAQEKVLLPSLYEQVSTQTPETVAAAATVLFQTVNNNTTAIQSLGDIIFAFLSTRAQLIAYAGNRREVFLQDNTRFKYYATYPLPANGKWILEAVGIGSGVWVNEDSRRVSVLRFGAKPGRRTDVSNAQLSANQMAMQSAIDSGEPLHLPGIVAFDGPLVISGVGDLGFSLQGIKGKSELIAVTDAAGIRVVSSASDVTGYGGRVQQVTLDSFNITKQLGTGIAAGAGIYVRDFGFVTLMHLQTLGFRYGLDVANGSEMLCVNVRTPGNARGMRFMRDTFLPAGAGADMAAVELISCHTHNNSEYGIEIDGARQVFCRGGSYGASDGIAAALIHGTHSAVDHVVFDGVNFENGPNNSQVILGKAGSPGAIAQVDFNSCQFAIPNNEKIIIHSNVGTVSWNGGSFDGGHSPYLVIKPTQLTNPKLVGLDGVSPYWIQYNIRDERDSNQPTPLRLFRNWPLVNAFNTTFRKSYAGYTPNLPIEHDFTLFVTGDRSLRFTAQTGDRTEKYLEIRFYSDGGDSLELLEGQTFGVDYIAKYADTGGNSIGYAILGVVTKSLSGDDTLLNYIYQVFPIQQFSNGFTRYGTIYTVPQGRKLDSVRVMNNASYERSLWLDSLNIYSLDVPVNTLIYGNSAPFGGYWNAGDRITAPTFSLDRPSAYECYQTGEPGLWRPVLLPMPPLSKSGTPSTSDVPAGLHRIVTNTVTSKTELVFNLNGTLLCMDFAQCGDTTTTPPSSLDMFQDAGDWELTENHPPVVSFATEFLSANQGQTFSHPVPANNTFTDPDNDNLTYTMQYSADGSTWGSLPGWATYNGTTFTGTPPLTAATSVTYRFRVTANDGHGGSVSDSFNLICFPDN